MATEVDETVQVEEAADGQSPSGAIVDGMAVGRGCWLGLCCGCCSRYWSRSRRGYYFPLHNDDLRVATGGKQHRNSSQCGGKEYSEFHECLASANLPMLVASSTANSSPILGFDG